MGKMPVFLYNILTGYLIHTQNQTKGGYSHETKKYTGKN